MQSAVAALKEELPVAMEYAAMDSSLRSSSMTSAASLRAGIEAAAGGGFKSEARVAGMDSLAAAYRPLNVTSILGEESLLVREEVSNATQTGLEDVVDQLKGNGAFPSVSEAVKELLPEVNFGAATATPAAA